VLGSRPHTHAPQRKQRDVGVLRERAPDALRRDQHGDARTGQAVGAVNLSTHATRTTRNEMREKFLPELRRIAQRISRAPSSV
jgi:hypothetical protein